MNSLVLALWATAVLAAEPPAITSARAHLEAGKLDDVLFDLQGQYFSGPDADAAADVLSRAAHKSLARNEALMALQFAQMALKLDKAQPQALEAAARACFAQQQFDPAEEYADRWIEATRRSPSAVLLRAELSLAQGDWEKSLSYVEGLSEASLDAKERAKLAKLRATANRELKDRKAGMSSAKALEERMTAALVEAKRLDSRSSTGHVKSRGIVVYGTSWCGYCRKARQWLKARGVPFEDKDVERDAGAAEELSRKAAAVGLRVGGVPIIDVHGTLVQGFDQRKLEQLLR